MVLPASRKRPRPAAVCRHTKLASCFFVSCTIGIGLWNIIYVAQKTTTTSSSTRDRLTTIPSFGNNHHQVQDDDDDGRVIPIYRPTNRACETTDGIYHIQMADIEGGVGTALFQLVITQLLYAEKHNLTPWVHFVPGISRVIEDPIVHHHQSTSTVAAASVVSFTALGGANVTHIQGRHHWRDVTPGAPSFDTANTMMKQKFEFAGTGIWGHYFEPVSDFVPGDTSCEDKPYVTMGIDNIYLVIPGLHGYSNDLSVRCWRYDYLPEYISKPHQSLHTWLAPQRARAAGIVHKYFRPRAYLQHRASQINPGCSKEHNPCLGLHIRHADKAAGRRVIQTSEFLPFAMAFVKHGGKQIYIATDSNLVVEKIRETWPKSIVDKLRTANDMVRSSDTTAVFDMTSHHRTNQEAIIEILALSHCQFLVHGHSAVSEAAIWMSNNLQLHDTSVNLEDDHLDATTFGKLVHMVLLPDDNDDDESKKQHWPKPIRAQDHWPPTATQQQQRQQQSLGRSPTNRACDGYDGVLLISAVGRKASTATAFFTSVLNQLIFADKHNLKPWVHLRNKSDGLIIYDEKVHNETSNTVRTFEMVHGMAVRFARHESSDHEIYPDRPDKKSPLKQVQFTVPPGNGIWNSYFEPVSDFVPGDESCRSKPLIEMEEVLVSPGMEAYCPWSVKAWRYDNIPGSLLQSATKGSSSMVSMEDWLGPMRVKAYEITNKYVRFQPYIVRRVEEVNPDSNQPCLGVHIRLADKQGKYRRKVKAGDFRDYIDAFARAGGRTVYVASDAQRPLQFMNKNFPEHLKTMIQTQGDHTVRSFAGEYPTHILDNHHRVKQ